MQAHIVPVFKKGDRGSVENYRPISLTSVTSKILEHIVHSSIMDHLDKHSSLNPFQHVFRQKRSCENQLVTTVRDLADCLNRKGQILWHADTGPILAYRNSTGKSMVILAGHTRSDTGMPESDRYWHAGICRSIPCENNYDSR